MQQYPGSPDGADIGQNISMVGFYCNNCRFPW